MLRSISWKQFMEFIAWAAVVYYLWVGARYYRHDIVDLLTGKRAGKDGEGGEPGKNVAGLSDRVTGIQGESNNKNKSI